VQKEVIQETLATEYGIEVDFRETTTICIERPFGTSESVEVLYAKTKTNVTGNSSPISSNPFLATVGLRLDPAPVGSGIEFRLTVDVRLVPIYIYRPSTPSSTIWPNVRERYRRGLFGWQVTGCIVTMIDSGYRALARPPTSGSSRLGLMSALKRAQRCPADVFVSNPG
jgi:ribosomal protection tetracycline resistance protein